MSHQYNNNSKKRMERMKALLDIQDKNKLQKSVKNAAIMSEKEVRTRVKNMRDGFLAPINTPPPYATKKPATKPSSKKKTQSLPLPKKSRKSPKKKTKSPKKKTQSRKKKTQSPITRKSAKRSRKKKTQSPITRKSAKRSRKKRKGPPSLPPFYNQIGGKRKTKRKTTTKKRKSTKKKRKTTKKKRKTTKKKRKTTKKKTKKRGSKYSVVSLDIEQEKGKPYKLSYEGGMYSDAIVKRLMKDQKGYKNYSVKQKRNLENYIRGH